MKKAKIMLSAIGLLSVVAGAVAFKAQHRFSGSYFCTGIKTTATIKFGTYTTNAALPVTVTLFCTQVENLSASTTYKVRALS